MIIMMINMRWDWQRKRFFPPHPRLTSEDVLEAIEREELVSLGLSGSNCYKNPLNGFMYFAGLNAHQIWRDLKDKARFINVHLGRPFNHAIDGWGFLERYGDECETQTVDGAGKNYPTEYYISVKDVRGFYSQLWQDYHQLKDLPEISFFFGKTGYFINEDEFIYVQGGEEYKILARLPIRQNIIVQNILTKRISKRSVMQCGMILGGVPMKALDKHLASIISVIDGSCSSASSLDLYFRYMDETFEKINDDNAPGLKYDNIYLENKSVEHYRVSNGDVVSVLAYRCAIDDYDVIVFINGNEMEHTGNWKYDEQLGFIKET